MTEVVSDWTVQVFHPNERVEPVVFSPGMATLCAQGCSLVGNPCAKAAKRREFSESFSSRLASQ